MFGLGMPEILLVLAIALIVIGPKKLPDLAKTLGRAMGEFKRSAQDFKKSIDIETTVKDFEEPVSDLKSVLKDDDKEDIAETGVETGIEADVEPNGEADTETGEEPDIEIDIEIDTEPGDEPGNEPVDNPDMTQSSDHDAIDNEKSAPSPKEPDPVSPEDQENKNE
jgi:Tat protein translocase TatB subunit